MRPFRKRSKRRADSLSAFAGNTHPYRRKRTSIPSTGTRGRRQGGPGPSAATGEGQDSTWALAAAAQVARHFAQAGSALHEKLLNRPVCGRAAALGDVHSATSQQPSIEYVRVLSKSRILNARIDPTLIWTIRACNALGAGVMVRRIPSSTKGIAAAATPSPAFALGVLCGLVTARRVADGSRFEKGSPGRRLLVGATFPSNTALRNR